MNTTELTIHHARGSSDPPFTKLSLDWFGERVRPSAEFSLSFEDDRLVFRSRRQKGALCQPGAEEGQFFAGVWFRCGRTLRQRSDHRALSGGESFPEGVLGVHI